jgi:outer membrane lipoprotein-sorting protein
MDRRSFIAAAMASLAVPGAALAQGYDPAVVNALSRYMNTITTMQGTFTQQSPDGRIAEGEFFIRRPGRLRFEYLDPYPTTVIADGTWAGVLNRQAKTLNQVPLSSTPLYLLLDDDIDLAASGSIQSIQRAPGIVNAKAIDPNNPGEGSITMVFSTTPVQLLKWVITDAQGRSSTISLRNVQRGNYIDPRKFTIPNQYGNRRNQNNR